MAEIGPYFESQNPRPDVTAWLLTKTAAVSSGSEEPSQTSPPSANGAVGTWCTTQSIATIVIFAFAMLLL